MSVQFVSQTCLQKGSDRRSYTAGCARAFSCSLYIRVCRLRNQYDSAFEIRYLGHAAASITVCEIPNTRWFMFCRRGFSANQTRAASSAYATPCPLRRRKSVIAVNGEPLPFGRRKNTLDLLTYTDGHRMAASMMRSADRSPERRCPMSGALADSDIYWWVICPHLHIRRWFTIR